MNPEGLRLIRVERCGERHGGEECRELGWLGVIQKVWEPRGVNRNERRWGREKSYLFIFIH